jgi:pteridine reductase
LETPATFVSQPVILVTGAARRVGAAISAVLHEAGAAVVMHYRSSSAAAEALATMMNAQRPLSAIALQADVGDPVELEHLVETIIERFGRLDGVVNNASSYFATPIGNIDEAAWQNLVNSNLKGPLFLAQAAAPHLRAAHGGIVNITDIHAERPCKGYPTYCAAKAGLLGLTRALAIELAPEVRVNAVAPGAIQWPDSSTDFSPEERQVILEHTLLKRIGEPSDIARTVRFLLFDAPYITGQVINVDGGRTAHL